MSNKEAKEILKHIGNNVVTINTYDGKIWHKEDIAEAKAIATHAIDEREKWLKLYEWLYKLKRVAETTSAYQNASIDAEVAMSVIETILEEGEGT